MKTPTLQELLKQVRERYNIFVKNVREFGDFPEVLASHTEGFLERNIQLAYSRGRESMLEEAVEALPKDSKDEDFGGNHQMSVGYNFGIRDSRTAIESLREKK